MGFLKVIGCLLLVALCLVAGANHVQDPAGAGKQIMAGNLPKILAKLNLEKSIKGFKFTTKEANLLGQAFGGWLIFSSVMIVLGVGRRFFAFLLALTIVGVSVCQHMNLENPLKTPLDQQIHFLKNLASVGGLLILVAGDDQVKLKKD